MKNYYEKINNSWEFNDLYRKAWIGFSGYIIQLILMLIFAMTIYIKFGSDNYRQMEKLGSLLVIFSPFIIAFWSYWFWHVKKINYFKTKFLNDNCSSESFKVPDISFIHTKHVPEVFLVIGIQIISLSIFVISEF